MFNPTGDVIATVSLIWTLRWTHYCYEQVPEIPIHDGKIHLLLHAPSHCTCKICAKKSQIPSTPFNRNSTVNTPSHEVFKMETRMLHRTHGLFESMDNMLRVEDLSMGICASAWPLFTHLMCKYPSLQCIFPWISHHIHGAILMYKFWVASWREGQESRTPQPCRGQVPTAMQPKRRPAV